MKRFASMFAACVLAALASPAFAAPTCVVGVGGASPTANITFTAPTLNVDGTPIVGPVTYNLYGATTSGAEVKGASGLAGSPIVLSTGLQNGSSYYFYVTVVTATGESAPSNEVCKIFPASLPGTVTITIT